MSSSCLYVRDGDILRPRGSFDSWKILREVGGAAIPSPLGGMSIHLPSVVAARPDAQERVFQQVSPRFWVIVNKGIPKEVWYA